MHRKRYLKRAMALCLSLCMAGVPAYDIMAAEETAGNPLYETVQSESSLEEIPSDTEAAPEDIQEGEESLTQDTSDAGDQGEPLLVEDSQEENIVADDGIIEEAETGSDMSGAEDNSMGLELTEETETEEEISEYREYVPVGEMMSLDVEDAGEISGEVHEIQDDDSGLLFAASDDADSLLYGDQLQTSPRVFYDRLVTFYKSGYTKSPSFSFSLAKSPVSVLCAAVKDENGTVKGIDVAYTNENGEKPYETLSTSFAFSIQSALDAFFFDYPEIFWCRPAKNNAIQYSINYKNSDKTDNEGNSLYYFYISVTAITMQYRFENAASYIDEFKQEVEAKSEEIGERADYDLDGTISEEEYLYAIHDYTCGALWYDEDPANDVIHSAAIGFIGSLGGGAVCEGYAKTVKVLCDHFDIPCKLACSDTHMWNIVRVNDSWYEIDATWDDTGDKSTKYTYFLSADGSGVSEHRVYEGRFSGVANTTDFQYPYISDTGYPVTVTHAHEFIFDSESSEASCQTPGTAVYRCTSCPYAYSEYSDAVEHIYKEEIVAPTHTEDGYTLHTCVMCGDSYKSDEVKALGHDYEKTVVPPTCTEKGYTTYTCRGCGYKYNDLYTEPVGHKYEENTVFPTCDEKGYTKHTCANCGDEYKTDETEPLGHDFGILISRVDPTCTEPGYEEKACIRCMQQVKEELPPLEHDWMDTIINPSCTNEGYTTHVCMRCGKTMTDSFVDATGHVMDIIVSKTEPTCTEKGYTTYRCSKCGTEAKDDFVEETGHDYESTVVTDSAAGKVYTNHVCRKCGDTYTSDIKELKYDANTITASDILKAYSKKKQNAKISAKAKYGGEISYKSQTAQVKVDARGNVTIDKKYAGIGTVVVTSKASGKHLGAQRIVYVCVSPQKTKISKTTAKKKGFTVKCKKVSGAFGYEIQYSRSKNFNNSGSVLTGKSGKATIKGLNKKKTYYVRIRAYVIRNGKTAYAPWSKTKKLKTK